jgi:hypothetical protein
VDRFDLRAADSFQLAAVLEWCEDAPQGRVFLTADQTLREAALLSGFDAKQMGSLKQALCSLGLGSFHCALLLLPNGCPPSSDAVCSVLWLHRGRDLRILLSSALTAPQVLGRRTEELIRDENQDTMRHTLRYTQ